MQAMYMQAGISPMRVMIQMRIALPNGMAQTGLLWAQH